MIAYVFVAKCDAVNGCREVARQNVRFCRDFDNWLNTRKDVETSS